MGLGWGLMAIPLARLMHTHVNGKGWLAMAWQLRWVCVRTWLILPLLSVLLSCTPPVPYPSDQQIWQGYFVITTQRLLTGSELQAAIDQVTPHVQIQRLSESVRTTDKAAFCYPPEWDALEPGRAASVVLVRMVTEPDAPEGISFALTQWEGSTDWFVNIPTAPGQCYRLIGE
jgi:hypothetical protein